MFASAPAADATNGRDAETSLRGRAPARERIEVMGPAPRVIEEEEEEKEEEEEEVMSLTGEYEEVDRE